MQLSALLQHQIIDEELIAQLDCNVIHKKYCTVGGGLGSFAWVDLLVNIGIKSSQIAVISDQNHPAQKFIQYCNNSNIDMEDRLRSDSGSTIDNIWGVPSYGVRELYQQLKEVNIGNAARIIFKLLSEPVLAEPYTPTLKLMVDGINKEAERIGWKQMLISHKAYHIRKTNKNRFLIASRDINSKPIVIVANYLYLSTGYNQPNYTKQYKHYHQDHDHDRYINIYDGCEEVTKQLRLHGGIIIIRGRGISASRLIENLSLNCNPQEIKILHFMRRKIEKASAHDEINRTLEHNWEYQHFNFPKSAFGGDIKQLLKVSNQEQRIELIRKLGGITSADRKHWRDLIKRGLKEGWYRIVYDDIESVNSTNRNLEVTGIKGQKYKVNFIIESTGLDSNIHHNFLYRDLLNTYELETTELNSLRVSKNFLIPKLSNSHALAFCVGVNSLGGYFAPVDSFAGLQYAALKSVELISRKEKLTELSGLKSLRAWIHWILDKPPQ